MSEPKFPEDMSVTIDGVTFTTQLFSYDDGGGEKSRPYIKTMNRKHKRARPKVSDFSISLSGTVVDNSFENRYNDEDTQTIAISWSDYTITYNNCDIKALNYEVDAEDRLVANMSFTTPYYDTTGSVNRVIS